MKTVILDELDQIERKYDVKIIYACESGSRAWGFASRDSDYDVRFIYAHPKEWYLTIGKKKDVIERPVDAVLDIGGWDLKKALTLLRKSNSPLMEWLTSPIVYRKSDSAMAPFFELARGAFLPETSCHHYLSLAKNSAFKALESDEPKIKTYLYALRAVLCAHWIIRYVRRPPMRFRELLAEFLPDGELREFIDELLQKKESHELKTVERSTVLEGYLKSRLNDLPSRIPKNSGKPSLEEFDRTFLEILEKFERL